VSTQPVGSSAPALATVSEMELVQLARRISQMRRKRDALFAPLTFADPEWDILLDLFAEGGSGGA